MIEIVKEFVPRQSAVDLVSKKRDWVRSHVSWRSKKQDAFHSGVNLEIKNSWVAGREDEGDKALWARILQLVNDKYGAHHLDGISGFYTRYEVGHHFAWHSDYDYPLSREWAAILQLSDPADYDGGVFEFKDQGPVSLQPGDLLLFPATDEYIHRVTKVTRGVRKSLVLWAFCDKNILPEKKAPPAVRAKYAYLRDNNEDSSLE